MNGHIYIDVYIIYNINFVFFRQKYIKLRTSARTDIKCIDLLLFRALELFQSNSSAISWLEFFRTFYFLTAKDFYIIWPSNILTLTIPGEGYSRNGSCALNFISMFSLFIPQLQEP